MKAKLLGRGGVRIVSDAFGVNPKTIRKGRQELLDLPDAPSKRIRKEGGGAKKLQLHPEWLDSFDETLEKHTAGLPQDEPVKWTYLSRRQIVDSLKKKGLDISGYHAGQMLRIRGYKKRKLLKMNDPSQTEKRNEQFEKITVYREQFTEMDFPVLSIDTKKKEMTG
ncbi:MAG: ISAzo13 family transposase, partial [Bacteroidales bacterium]|nr:ISAzo13 family transposase [Bacteroidales bacterium]